MRKKRIIYLYKRTSFVLVYLLLLVINNLSAQSDEDCLMCHEDPELTTLKHGKTISLYVNSKVLNRSVHKNVTCASCHKDAAVEEFPHPETLKKIDCGSCHTTFAEQAKYDIHHKLKDRVGTNGPACKTCHGTHKIQHPAKVENKAEVYCGKCHKENVLSAPYHAQSIVNKSCLECHDKKDYIAELAKSVHSILSCSNCHGYVVNNLSHHEKEPENGQLADCYKCHHSIANEHKESIHGLAVSEGIMEAAQCWDCHGSHSIYPTSTDSSKVYRTNLVSTCGACHDDPVFVQEHSFAVKQPGKMYSLSVHGKLVEAGRMDAATCAVCHGIHDIKNRIQLGSKISSVNLPETCSECHKEITEEYKQSIHWIGVKKGVRESPTCNDCHSEHSIHAINTIDKREEIKKIQEETCLECHQNILLSERYGLAGKNAGSYQDSYHGLAVKRGDKDAAMCVDCHGVHKILPKYHEESTINKKNVLVTCKKCHSNATDVFSNSYSHVTEEDTTAQFVEDLVGTIYFWLIIVVIGGMILHNLIIFIYDIREKQKKIKNEIKIPRFTTNELLQHIILIVSFTILAITGFQLKFPDSWWSEGLTYLGMDEITRQYVHRGAAVVMIVLSLYHVFYLLFTSRGRAVVKSLLPNLSDIKLAIHNVLFYLHLRKEHPEFDNYNYTEKAEYWALIWGTIIMGFTGFILWFPTIVGDWAPVWFIKVCEILHFYEAILATLAIIVWHWFFVIFRPKEYPLSFTCVNGKMTIAHYKDEHKLRYKKIIAEWLEVKSGKRSQKQLSHLSKLFISAIEKSGVNPDEFFQTELDNDDQLKALAEKLNL